MDTYWQHRTDESLSPKYNKPELLLQHTDQYYEDYCIRRSTPYNILRTIGVRVCSPNYQLLNRYQNRHVLHWIIGGKAVFNGITVEEGDVIYCKRNIPYSLVSDSDNPCVYAWITFYGTIAEQNLQRVGLIKKFHIYQTSNLRECYQELYDLLYVSHEQMDVGLYLESCLFRLLALSVPSGGEKTSNTTAIDPRLNVALQYIVGHYQKKDFCIRHVSEVVGISESHLRKLFKESLGLSARSYIVKLRIDAAESMLKSSTYNIGEIAEIVGYSDHRQFSDLFRKHIGCSPTQYRKNFYRNQPKPKHGLFSVK